jgi:hypothetical protein
MANADSTWQIASEGQITIVTFRGGGGSVTLQTKTATGVAAFVDTAFTAMPLFCVLLYRPDQADRSQTATLLPESASGLFQSSVLSRQAE